MYLSIFARTFAALAATALVAAQTLKWDSPEAVRSSATVLGFALLMALIGAVIASLWALAGSPAVTPFARALRSAVQALLASPLAILVGHAAGWDDFVDVDQMVVPTLVAVVLAFLISLASNVKPAPSATSTEVTAKPAAADFLGIAA